tara:strand:- start:764 stop:940 length:177 start_codon:yes stop_codon:yes gene_type:complete
MNDKQREAIAHIHEWHEIETPLEDYIATALPQIGWPDSLIIKCHDMYIGIEPDGSRHT